MYLINVIHLLLNLFITSLYCIHVNYLSVAFVDCIHALTYKGFRLRSATAFEADHLAPYHHQVPDSCQQPVPAPGIKPVPGTVNSCSH